MGVSGHDRDYDHERGRDSEAPPGAAARATLRRAVLRPGWVVCGLLALLALAGLSARAPPAVRYAPFVVSLVVLGLPHGAVDHLAELRARGGEVEGLRAWLHAPAAGALARVSLLYAVLGGLYLAAWLVAPLASFVFFILLTWFHWGQGDLYAMVGFVEESHLRSRLQRALAVLVRGGLPMLVPLLGGPAEYREVAELTVGLFAPGGTAAVAPLFRPGTRLALGVAFGTLTVAALGLGLLRARETGTLEAWRLDAVETVLLWAYFLTVGPILAVGVYFTVWHALRHVARLVALDGPAERALAAGDLLEPAVRFARDAAPLTAISLFILGGLYVALPTDGSLGSLLAVYLVLLAVLTLPHVVVVSRMDRAQGVW